MKTFLAIAAFGLGCWAAAMAAQAQVVEKAALDATKKSPPATAPDGGSPGEADFQAGRLLFFQGNVAAAIDKLRAAVAADPAKTAYKLLLAKSLRVQGKNAQAQELLADIIKANPDHVEAGVELAEIVQADPKDDKRFDRVVQILEPLLKFKHDYPLYHMLAEAYYQKEDLAKAREYFEEAVKLNPRSADDYYQLANIYLAQSHFAKAADAYERAHALGIEQDVLHFKLASVYFNLRNYLGRVTTAAVLGGQVGQIKNDLLLLDPVPGKTDTFYVAGPRSAIFQAVRARLMGIKVPQLAFLEANIWLNARRFAKADAIYKDLADALAGKDPDRKLAKSDLGLFWFYWAQAALGLDDFDQYLARLNKAIEADPATYKPTLADAYVAVARRYQQRGDDVRYIENLTRAVNTNPLSAGLHLTLGDALWQLNKRPAAVEQYKLVLELEPDHPDRVRLLNRIRDRSADESAAATSGPPPAAGSTAGPPAAGQ